MELSQDVAKARLNNIKDQKNSGKKGRTTSPGPFAGMNRTKVNIPRDELEHYY
jgi:hypothetical protein